jgi:hypothetical protein
MRSGPNEVSNNSNCKTNANTGILRCAQDDDGRKFVPIRMTTVEALCDQDDGGTKLVLGEDDVEFGEVGVQLGEDKVEGDEHGEYNDAKDCGFLVPA